MRLWYWLSDEQTATLNIYYRQAIGSAWLSIVSIRNSTTDWVKVSIDVPPLSTSFQVNFTSDNQLVGLFYI
jgi:uncharacterized protein (DUF736 family)